MSSLRAPLGAPHGRLLARCALLAVLLAATGVLWWALLHGAAVEPAQIIKSAVCNGSNASQGTGTGGSTANAGVSCSDRSLNGFIDAANSLINPVVVAMIAVCPLGCLVGAGALMFGSRRGLLIVGSSIGTLVFVGSIKGIIA
jgi:hypothetical protein